MVIYLHKMSVSDLVRDWVVKQASEIMQRAGYQKSKKAAQEGMKLQEARAKKDAK